MKTTNQRPAEADTMISHTYQRAIPLEPLSSVRGHEQNSSDSLDLYARNSGLQEEDSLAMNPLPPPSRAHITKSKFLVNTSTKLAIPAPAPEIGPVHRPLRPERRLSNIVKSLTYHTLLSPIHVTNLVVFIAILSIAEDRNDALKMINMSALNTFFAGVAFHQVFIDTSYRSCANCLTRKLPLTWRIWIINAHQSSHVHINCGVWATVWYICFAVTATMHFMAGKMTSIAVLTITHIVLTVVIAIFVSSLPIFCRSVGHGSVRLVHRYASWLALLLFWVLLLVYAIFEQQPHPEVFLLSFPAFWYKFMGTCFLVADWCSVHRVRVWCERLPTGDMRIHLSGQPQLKDGKIECQREFGTSRSISVAMSVLGQWKRFPVFPDLMAAATVGGDIPGVEEPAVQGYSCLLLKDGAKDDSSDSLVNSIIKSTPTKLCLKRNAALNPICLLRNFDRSLVVMLGTEVAPLLSLLNDMTFPKLMPHETGSSLMIRYRVVWKAKKEQFEGLGPQTGKLVRRLDSDAVLIDEDDASFRDVNIEGIVTTVARQSDSQVVALLGHGENVVSEKRRLGEQLRSKGLPVLQLSA